jgi:hypothetical protein
MITETGGNLNVVIMTEPDKNWQSFATWYSIYKNWPDAKVAIICHRNGQLPFESFQWARRLKIPILHRNPCDAEIPNVLEAICALHNQKHITDSILVLKPLMMALDIFDNKFLKLLNDSECWRQNDIWYLKNQNLVSLLESYYIADWSGPPAIDQVYVEANQVNELSCLVSCEKGCGRWIDTSRGCPFSSADALIAEEMTANEVRVNDLWRKMVPLYNSVV